MKEFGCLDGSSYWGRALPLPKSRHECTFLAIWNVLCGAFPVHLSKVVVYPERPEVCCVHKLK